MFGELGKFGADLGQTRARRPEHGEEHVAGVVPGGAPVMDPGILEESPAAPRPALMFARLVPWDAPGVRGARWAGVPGATRWCRPPLIRGQSRSALYATSTRPERDWRWPERDWR